MMNRKSAAIVAACVAIATLTGCYTVPETGRQSLNLLSPNQEIALGATAFEQIKGSERVSTDETKNAAVQRVGRRIANAVGDDLKEAQWEFVLFENDAINAFALPGGKVGVYTGLFKVAQTEDELAVVIGHEIAHVTARHGAERMSHGVLLDIGGAFVEVFTADKEEAERERWQQAYGLGATFGVVLPFSRLNESEADEIGLVYSARAGFDPRTAVGFWRRMKEAKEGKQAPPEWLSTHPSDDTRIKDIEAMLPRMIAIYDKARGSGGGVP